MTQVVSRPRPAATARPAAATACTATVTVLIPALTIVETAAAPTVTPGARSHSTITLTNTGQTPYTGAGVSDSPGRGARRRDLQQRRGRHHRHPSLRPTTILTWTGDLAVGASATITYSVTVNGPDTGDRPDQHRDLDHPGEQLPAAAPTRPAPPPSGPCPGADHQQGGRHRLVVAGGPCTTR